MFSRRPPLLTLVLASAFLVACSDSPTAPRSAPAAGLDDYEELLSAARASTSSGIAGCTQRTAAFGSATIGREGGVVQVGTNYLVIPPRALSQPTLITGRMSAESFVLIDFQPTGLVFQKAATLMLDATGCSVNSRTPSILRVEDDGTVAERIHAYYLKHWQRVVAPISHFSAYAIGV
jgi:hypothetical protein